MMCPLLSSSQRAKAEAADSDAEDLDADQDSQAAAGTTPDGKAPLQQQQQAPQQRVKVRGGGGGRQGAANGARAMDVDGGMKHEGSDDEGDQGSRVKLVSALDELDNSGEWDVGTLVWSACACFAVRKDHMFEVASVILDDAAAVQTYLLVASCRVLQQLQTNDAQPLHVLQ